MCVCLAWAVYQLTWQQRRVITVNVSNTGETGVSLPTSFACHGCSTSDSGLAEYAANQVNKVLVKNTGKVPDKQDQGLQIWQWHNQVGRKDRNKAGIYDAGYTGGQLFMVSKVLCLLWSENCTPEGRGSEGEKREGEQISKNSTQNLWHHKFLALCTWLQRNYLSLFFNINLDWLPQ